MDEMDKIIFDFVKEFTNIRHKMEMVCLLNHNKHRKLIQNLDQMLNYFKTTDMLQQALRKIVADLVTERDGLKVEKSLLLDEVKQLREIIGQFQY